MTRFLSSLRGRLTLAFVALLAVLFGALGVYQYFALRASLVANRTAALQTDYATAHALLARLSLGFGVRQVCARAPVLAARSIATTITQTSGRTVDVAVYSPALALVATAPRNDDLPSLDTAVLQRVLTTRRAADPSIHDTRDGPSLVVAFPVVVRGNVCGVAQMSTSLSSINHVLADEVVLLALGGAAALLVALVLALVLTGRTLRPLRRLTATAEELAAGDLSARSRLVPRSDEVGALAASFDHMADRIEESFAAQRESGEQVRRFIADASHELRTPVTALKGYIDVLRRGAGRNPESLEPALEAMAREAGRMRELVLDMLTLARLDTHGRWSAEVFDVSAELGRVLDEGHTGMPATVERQFDAETLAVRCDRGAFGSIIRNVLANACKYAPGAAQHWRTSAENGRARIDARDDGPGIPSADLPFVFDRFYRGEKMRSREEGGSGLGLAIVQGLARAQGGDATIASVEGAGTTVTVWLPAAP